MVFLRPFQTEKVLCDGSVCLYVTPLLDHQQNYMSKGNRRNQPEREFAALAKRAI
jgi:hypothetical protein